jgi:hypothetical protein
MGASGTQAISVEISAGIDHGWQFTRTNVTASGLFTPGKRIGESVLISTSVSFTLSLTWGESRRGASSKTPEIASPTATFGWSSRNAVRVASPRPTYSGCEGKPLHDP